MTYMNTNYSKDRQGQFTKKNWGIWNGVEKRFVFGIDAETKDKAWRAFAKATEGGDAMYKWRYEVRPIPIWFDNPRNQCRW